MKERFGNMVLLNKLSAAYSPQEAADRALLESVTVTGDSVKGAHDAQFIIDGGKAYIVYECNDIQAGENAGWTFIYCAMSIVDVKTRAVEKIIKISESGQAFNNESLQEGATFVPRIVKKSEGVLRVFFSSERPGVRQSIMDYVDFDIADGKFESDVHRFKIETPAGKVDFTPEAFYNLAVQSGVECFMSDTGAFLFDIFEVGGSYYVALNNFMGKQNALGVFNDSLDCVSVLGHIGSSNDDIKLSEAGIARLNDGTWMSVIRDDAGKEYRFSYSLDGTDWSVPRTEPFALGGTDSKPTLNNYSGTYFLGWNESSRSAFNFAASSDSKHWTALYEFISPTTFQYPCFVFYEDEIYFTATVGNKEDIVFGKLFLKCINGKFYIDDSFTDTTEKFFSGFRNYNELGNIQTNPDGTVWTAGIERSDFGVYFRAETDRYNVRDKLFLMLDTEGSRTSLRENVFMIKFCGKDMAVQTYSADGKSLGYANLKKFADLKLRRSVKNGGCRIDLFIPFNALKEIQPLCGFKETKPLYVTAYGANGINEYALSYDGAKLQQFNPSTYLELSSDNVLKKRS